MKKRPLALLIAAAFLLSACSAPPAPAPAETAVPAAEVSAADAAETLAPAAPKYDPAVADKLRLSEIMPKNRATLAAEDGKFYDWIELRNLSDESVSLDGWAISDGPDQRPWPLPSRTLAPGEYCWFSPPASRPLRKIWRLLRSRQTKRCAFSRPPARWLTSCSARSCRPTKPLPGTRTKPR